MAIGGVEYEQTLGMMTAITEIQRSGAKAARGLVSIQSRYNQILDDTSSTGQKLIAFYDEHHIQLYDQEGQLRSLWETLSDVAEIWGTLDENEQKYFLNIQAGANQSVQLGALMGNFQTAIEATETALNSAGSAMRENESYMQSLNARTDLLKATFQTLANDVIPKELIAKGLDILDKFLKLLDTDLGVVLTRITMLTGIGWGFSSLASASKILPTIISQFSNFAKLLSGAAITIPKVAAEAGGLTAALATFQSVALPVIGILTALGVGIYAIWENAKDTVSPVDELTGSLKKLNDDLQKSNENFESSNKNLEATANTAEKYVKRLEELENQSSLTTEEQIEYNNILHSLESIIPSVSNVIDKQTGSIIGGTNALREQIQAWKDLAIQQAYQERLTELYKNYANVQIEYEQRKLELQEVQTQRSEAENLLTQAVAKRNQLLAALDATTNKAERQTIGAQIGYYQNIIDEQQKLFMSLGAEKIPYTTALEEFEKGLVSAQEEIDKTEKAISELMSSYTYTPPPKEEEDDEEEDDDTKGGNSNFSQSLEKIVEEQLNIKEIIDSYLNKSENYINLLETQHDLLVLEGASEEEILSKIKKIQEVRHEEAETLRKVLQNADKLNLTTDDIYEIQTLINERSIDWWNWQNKIKTDSEEIVDNYEQIEEASEDIRESQIAMLNQEKDAISALSSAMVDYYDKQIDEIDNQIQALKDSNAEIEEQIALEEKLDAVARARQNKVYVFKDGRFQYVEDIDAVSSATKDLESYKRKQQLETEIAGLEAEKQALENMQSAWSNMVQDYEKEQDRWLISQELGINTALEGWERLVSGAETYAKRYKQIMNSLSELESQTASSNGEMPSFGGRIEYDPNVDYSDLILQSKTITEAKHWATKRDAKIEGERLSPSKSTQEFLREWQENYNQSYANGTLSALGGMSLVGEHGAELRILNRGDGIIPANMTSNLMSWGMISPNQFKAQSFGGFGGAMNITIQALNLPNVSDGAGFVDYVRNNMFGQVLSLVH